MRGIITLLTQEEEKGAGAVKLCGFCHTESTPKEETYRHIHPTLEVFYFASGRGVVEVGKTVLPVKAHDLVVVDSSKLHIQYFLDEAESLSYYAFEVDGVDFSGFNKNSMTVEGYFHHSFGDGDNAVYATILQMVCEADGGAYRYEQKLQLLFNAMFIDLTRLVFTSTKSSRTGAVTVFNVRALERVKGYIDEHYEKELDIEDLARLAFMSKSYFITQFKTFFQITPKQYLNLVRVQRACYLLTATDDSVVKIALKVGFGNPVYFTELFTRINGESPTAYRRSRGVSGR
jgi:AraC-like DNA-binding protein